MNSDFGKWFKDANEYMQKHYSITLTDGMGLELSYLKSSHADGMRYDEFCERLATKYDLSQFETFLPYQTLFKNV